MDKISVIVPVYNVEKYLRNCVESILKQTFHNLEIILVDDGSPDGCPAICEEYALKDDRVKVIHKENGGLSDARNAGIDAATGELIMFVDSDDRISEDMVEKLWHALTAAGADLAVCNVECVAEDTAMLLENDAPIKDEVLPAGTVIRSCLFKRSWVWVVVWNKLYRRKLFDEVRFPKGKIHEDEFIFHHIFLQCGPVACVSDSLYFYTQRGGSITSELKNDIKRLDAAEAMFLRAEALLREGYDQAALTSAELGLGIFCDYYRGRKKALDDAHKQRNRSLEELYRRFLRELLPKIKLSKRIKLRLYGTDLYGFAGIRNLVRKNG